MPQVATQGKPVDAVDGAGGCLLRIEEVAERLSVSRSMAWKIIDGGQLRSLRIGRVVRIRPEDLDAYLADSARQR
jgi:excisionase family DNA binding protein